MVNPIRSKTKLALFEAARFMGRVGRLSPWVIKGLDK